MPHLGLINNVGNIKKRSPKVFLKILFKTGTDIFNVMMSNAEIGNVDEALRVTATATNGYTKRAVTVAASTKYHLRIKLVSSSAGTGDKTVMVGTTSGASDLLSLSTPGTDGFTVNKYYDGTFTTDGSTTSVHLGLKVQTSGKTATWDDILIETYDTE